MLHQLARVLTLGLLSIASAGCCCVQGLPGNACGTGSCGIASCGGGRCGSGPLMNLAGCRGACGEVYVDEWISEPPTVDNCGPNCGGCSQCYQPVRNILRRLWGRPYMASCDTGLCGPSCDGGCDSYSGASIEGETYLNEGTTLHDGGPISSHNGSSCNCGGAHSSPSHAAPMSAGPSQLAPVPAPALQSPSMDSMPMPEPGSLPNRNTPMETVPQVAPQDALPAPTPSATPPSSARRLNPALSRRR